MPSNVLDVGAGSGRDARALAAMGHRVVAVEPSEAFRSVAVREGDRLRWVDDRLPDLPHLVAEAQRFRFILCSAVLMLVPATRLERCFTTFATLLTPGGALAVSLRAPAPGEPADVFHAHADADVVEAAETAGFRLTEQATPPDALGRQTLRWRSFVFTSGE
nr:class I SAM-dependent methyltransferase [Sphingomonas liriopis]